jgi:predicted nucleic acid-binding protein
VAWLERVSRAETKAFVPDLIYAEVGQALAGYVRAGELTRDDARARMELVSELPATVHSSRSLAPTALEFALTLGTTVDDACYLVLAELRDCLLVTADRRLAAAAVSSELVP